MHSHHANLTHDADSTLLLSHHTSLYDLILPSFSTLVELRIRFPEASVSRQLNLLPLKPIGGTLQKFFYKAHTFDPNLLDTIPAVFPHLTTLELMFWETPQDADSLWKVRSQFFLLTSGWSVTRSLDI